MWYKSTVTEKVVHSSAAKLIDNVYGKEAFRNDVDSGIIIPIEAPSVVDVLRDTGSVHLAAVRYREIHHCSVREAKAEVKRLKADISAFNKPRKGQRGKWKKNTAKAVSTENSQDTIG